MSALATGGQDTAIARPGRRGWAWPHHEFWPSWVFYAPVVAHALWLGARAGHPLAFTAVNPGIPCGGGLVGESKFGILAALAGRPGERERLGPGELGRGSPIAPTHLIRAGGPPSERAARVEALLADGASGLAWPFILKPDQGQRGAGVRLARSMEDVRAYFDRQAGDVLAQAYHPGPEEVGVLWVRTPEAPRGRTGVVFSITRKRFQHAVGDGVRTLERLILDHPRLRRQARTFLARFPDAATRVPAAGERVRLNVAGNHCQGTLFEDGGDLLTPALEAAIDALAAAFPGPDGRPGGLDFGRFDLRFRSEADLRAGRLDAGAIVELNGSGAESTNVYDPRRSARWAYATLRAQWGHLYRLGRERMDAGERPLGPLELWRTARVHCRGRGEVGSD